MPSTTTNYSLAIYNISSDTTELFSDYRADMAGTSGSNMILIDTALDDLQSQIDVLSAQTGIAFVDAVHGGSGVYTATVSGITSYDTDQFINLRLDTESPGAITININTLGAKSVKKINISGTAVDLTAGDMKENAEYICRYDGTQFIWNNAVAIDQVFVRDGTVTTEFLSNDVASGGAIPSGILETAMVRRFSGKTTAPTTTDDSGSGYRITDVWIDETNDAAYMAVDVTASAAVWIRITGDVALTDINVMESSTTWNKPTDLHHVVVEVIGAGGGGGGAEGVASEMAVGRSGGGGGYSRKYILASALGSTETVTVGTGGSGGAAGNNNGATGGTTSFGSHLQATGGEGGNGRASTASFPAAGATGGGAGGTGSGGDINLVGGESTIGIHWNSGNPQSSQTGTSIFRGLLSATNSSPQAGQAGVNYGSGGGGAQVDDSGTSYAGGDGADGVVIVYEYTYI